MRRNIRKNIRRKSRKIAAGILGISMLLGCTVSGFPTYAAKGTGTAANGGAANAVQGTQKAEQGASNAAQGTPDTKQGGSNAAQGAPGTKQGASNAAQGAPGTEQGASNAAQGAPGTEQGGSSAAQGTPDTKQGGSSAAQGTPDTKQGGSSAAQGAPGTEQGASSAAQGAPGTGQGTPNTAQGASDKNAPANGVASQSAAPGSKGQANVNGAAEQTENQKNMKENSWRYQDGNQIPSAQNTLRSVPYPHAWEKVNGVYMNSYGEPIEGAVQKGMDVSEHQGKIDWNKVKASGIDYVILRCGFGDDTPSQDDKCWDYNVSECERLGIPYGVYIYSYATNVSMAESEANHVLRLIRGHNLTFPVYYDMEDNSTINVSADIKGQMAQKFADIITAAGYSMGIYANLNWFNTQLTSPVFNNPAWSKWVAQYNSTCDYGQPYDMWQYTDVGKVNGITGNVDMNFLMDTYKGPGGGIKPDSGQDSGSDSGSDSSGTGGTTLAVRRGNEYHFKYTLSDGPADVVVKYGKADDTVLVGDWDGDGVDTLCVRRGNTYYFKNSLSSGEADKVVKYGRADDKVLVGDWDGDGVDSLCVRRGNTYYIKNSLADGEADKVVKYGRKDDTVMTGDWDGDGVDTLCVRRGHTYYIKNSLADGVADATISYGHSDDKILVGDWDGDGVDTLCVRRGNEYHIKNTIQAGNADQIVKYGKKDDITYAGKWQ